MAIVRLQKKFGKVNHSRDTVPPELEKKGVPVSLWATTVDGFKGWHNWTQQNGGRTHHNRGQINASDSAGVVMTLGIVFAAFGVLIPIFFVVGLACMISACCIGASNSSPSGRSVQAWHTFDTFLHNQQKSYDRYNVKLRREGLDRFPELVLETTEDAASSYQPPQTMAQELQALASLHQSGALTTEEFTRAKDRVIQGQKQQNEFVPSQAPAVPVPVPAPDHPSVPIVEAVSAPEIV